jgi:hypothetical protein
VFFEKYLSCCSPAVAATAHVPLVMRCLYQKSVCWCELRSGTPNVAFCYCLCVVMVTVLIAKALEKLL